MPLDDRLPNIAWTQHTVEGKEFLGRALPSLRNGMMAKRKKPTPNKARLIRVFVSSPGDVQAERDAVNGILERINDAVGEEHGFLLRSWKWESHVS